MTTQEYFDKLIDDITVYDNNINRNRSKITDYILNKGISGEDEFVSKITCGDIPDEIFDLYYDMSKLYYDRNLLRIKIYNLIILSEKTNLGLDLGNLSKATDLIPFIEDMRKNEMYFRVSDNNIDELIILNIDSDKENRKEYLKYLKQTFKVVSNEGEYQNITSGIQEGV